MEPLEEEEEGEEEENVDEEEEPPKKKKNKRAKRGPRGLLWDLKSPKVALSRLKSP